MYSTTDINWNGPAIYLILKWCLHWNNMSDYSISWSIRRTVIFLLEILEKNNDECILILVIYWKKTGSLHTKISKHNIIYWNKTGLLHTKISNHNIIYSSQKPRKSLPLPLKSSSWLFSLDASLSSYKMSSSLPSSALLMPHFFKDFTIVSLLTHCQEFFTHSQTLEYTRQIYFKERVTHLNYTWLHFATAAA